MPENGEDDPNAGAPPRPNPPKPKRESSVIEGGSAQAERAKTYTAAAAPQARRSGSVAAGAIGGVIGAVLTLASLWVFDLGADPAASAKRIDALEAQNNDAKAAIARIAALESADASAAAERKTLAGKVAALEVAKPEAGVATTNKLDALEAAEAAGATQLKSLADDVASLKNAGPAPPPNDDLEKRVAALEAQRAAPTDSAAAPAGPDPRVAEIAAGQSALSDKLAKQDADAGALAGRLDKLEAAVFAAKAETRAAPTAPTPKDAGGALTARLDKLEAAVFAAKAETRAAPTEAASLDAGALTARLDKLEAAVFAAKSETRAAPTAANPVAADALAPTVRAIAALALRARLRDGEPFAAELSALESSGVDASLLAPLKPYAEAGVSTPAALARSFQEVAPKLQAASQPAPSSGGRFDRIFGEVQGLVKVRKVGESPAGEPDAAAPRAQAALANGDLVGAVAALKDLPAAALAPASDWLQAAEARIGAAEAADALVRQAITDLGASNK